MIAALMRTQFDGVPYWISLSVGSEGGTTAAGEPLAESARAIMTAAGIDDADFQGTRGTGDSAPAALVGLGVNCCAPSAALAAVRLLARAIPRSLELIVYPNKGEVWDGDAKVWRTPEVDNAAAAEGYSDWAKAYVDAGASVVGGCCRVGPEDIAEFAAAIDVP